MRSYIIEFDGALTHEEYNNERFSYRLLFKKKLVNRPGQADRVVEFIRPDSELAKQIDKEYWVKKEVERPKYRPKDVVAVVRKAGFPRFRIRPEHVDMWKDENAKDPAKGYGVDVQGYGTGTSVGSSVALNFARPRARGTSDPMASANKPMPQTAWNLYQRKVTAL